MTRTAPSIDRLKKQAKALKKATGQKHCQCLEAIAQQHGYSTWASLVAARNGGAA